MTVPHLFALAATGGAAVPFVPTDISGCLIWLDPSDLSTLTLDGNEIEAIANKGSATGLNLADQGEAVQGPDSTQTLNGLTVMDFIPNDTLIDADCPLYSVGSITLFIVARADATTGAQVMYSEGRLDNADATYRFGVNSQAWWASLTDLANVDRFSITAGDIVNGNYHICMFDDSSTLARLYLDDPTTVAASSGAYTRGGSSPTFNRSAIGHNSRSLGTLWFDGRIAEMIAYNSVLSSGDRGDVFDYLNSKWGLGL
jgi:hypothetical protein